MPLIRSISGLRATLGDFLSPQVVCDYVSAFSALLPPGPVVVGRDGRPSGLWMESLVIATLAACERPVHSAGMVPTPTVQLLTERSDAVGGIIITASHNPAAWNGLKFIAADGVFLDAQQNAELWKILDAKTFHYSSKQQPGQVTHIENAIDIHVQAVLDLPLFDPESLERIRARKAKVVVDAVNCSGSVAVPTLLRSLGVEVVELFCSGSGEFPHTPEPLTENLSALRAAVIEHGAVLGIAVDPDADRLVLIDERGEAIGEEKTVMLAIEAVMRNKQKFGSSADACAVVNLSTSRMAIDAAARYGAQCRLAPVGEINVVRAMQEHHAIVGGEGSGGVIVPACHSGRDSLVGVALVLWLLASTEELEWQHLLRGQDYAMIKFKQEVAVRPTQWNVQLSDEDKASCTIDQRDGVRIDWPNKWVQLRASNTEAIVRIIAEAPTEAEARALIRAAQAWI